MVNNISFVLHLVSFFIPNLRRCAGRSPGGVFPDSCAHLFIFPTVNGVELNYNGGPGSQYVQVDTSIAPGSYVPPNTAATYAIFNFAGNWWFQYNNTLVGYYLGSLWNNQFNTADQGYWYGEVYSAVPRPCSWMGNGVPGSTGGGAAAIIDMNFIFASVVLPAFLTQTYLTNTSWYSLGNLQSNAFTYGGPGSGCL